MRKIGLLVSVVISLVCVLPAMAESLRVVTLYSPPLAYEDKGKVTGFAAELVREGLKRMGYEADISILPWKRAVFMTRFGEADAIFYAVRNEEREAWFHYPEESLVEEATVSVKRAGEDVVLEPGKFYYPRFRLGIGLGYYYGPQLRKFIELSRFVKIEEAPTIEDNFCKLVEGRIDVFLADLNVVRHFIKKRASQGLVEIVMDGHGEPIILDSVDSFLAFSRETTTREVADQFSAILQEMKCDGTYERILDEYR